MAKPDPFAAKLLSVLPAMLMLAGCGASGSDPLPPEPVIELQAVNPSTIVALQDSIVFVLAYTDGDGDLGFPEADSAAVYITDERFPLTEGFHLAPLAPEGAAIAITGVLIVVLPRTIMKDPTAASEQAIFSIRVRDRAGNWSNTEQSGALTVLPD